jgi:hypothetical protein
VVVSPSGGGDETTTLSFLLDPPTPHGLNGWYTVPVRVALGLGADHPGAAAEFRLDAGSWKAYTDPVLIDAEGEVTIEFRATDRAGMSDPVSRVIRRDASGPEVSVSGIRDGALYAVADRLRPSWSATDTLSGVDRISARLDGDVLADEALVEGLSPGRHSLTVTAVDRAGNTRSRTVTFDVTTVQISDIQHMLTDFTAQGRLAQHVELSLRDRLVRAGRELDTGSELRAIAYLEQMVARARNQIKGDDDDVGVRRVLVTAVESLIRDLRLIEETERTGTATV